MSELVPDSMSARDLEDFLHEKIPLTRAMGMRVLESNATHLRLEAPLEPNRNHLGTAFGGALHTMPILACYAALWMTLRDAGIDAHVIVRRSSADYKLPVTGPLRACAARPPAEISAGFIADLHRHKKARMELSAIVEGPARKPAVVFHGSFVAVI